MLEAEPAATEPPISVRATVTNLDVPFWQMVWLLIKLAVAAIPATIILWLVGMLLSGSLLASCRAMTAGPPAEYRTK